VTSVHHANHARRGIRALVIMFVSLGVYLYADLGSKEWALDNLSRVRQKPAAAPVCTPDEQGYTRYQRIPTEPAKVWVEGYLVAHYAENCGAAFGMLRTAPSWVRAMVFGLAALGACVVLTMMFIRGAGGKLFGAAVPLILSGAIGNVSDRLRHGFVVDFIQVDPRLFEYPTFNVADIAISVGVGLLLIDGMRKPAPAPASSTPHESPQA
jgi:signal peptidase II